MLTTSQSDTTTTMNDQAEENSELSPSLATRDAGFSAYEVKFIVNEAQARALEAWAGQQMHLDSHGDPNHGGTYQITSLYTDTAGFDVYHRTPKYRRRKYRLRRYGNESTIHLEQKFRKGERVMKLRTAVPDSELSQLANVFSVSDWAGNWFHQHLIRKELLPTCQITYRRIAFQGKCSEGPIRLTMDHHIFGQHASRWNVGMSSHAIPLLSDDSIILELKFRDAMPSIFKQFVADMQLAPSGFSKYRHCMDAWRGIQSLGKVGGDHA